MKCITFPGSAKLAGVAAMLERLGFDTDDRSITLGMRAPWLFLYDQGRFMAGASLCQPRWVNLYLTPLGFRMTEKLLNKTEIPAYLRSCETAMLSLTVMKNVHPPVVYTGYADGRYRFVNLKPENSNEPDSLSLTGGMLGRRLADQSAVLTVEKCPPAEAEIVPLLVESLKTLARYQSEMLETLDAVVTRKEFLTLSKTHLKALLQDMLPMAELIDDAVLTEELCLLNHDYRHVFSHHGPDTVRLGDRLPRSAICRCISWMRENIIDQLYEQGLTDPEVEHLLKTNNL